MRILVSTTGIGVGRTEEERRKTLEQMVDGFVGEVIKAIKPDKTILFYTEGTNEMVELIMSRTVLDIELVKISDPDDFNVCFKTMLEVLRSYSEHDLYVNYTYGTKTMSSAMASSAIFVDARLICVAGERRGGIVRRGLERVTIFEPYRFKDIITLEKMARLFNVYNFDAAVLEAKNLRTLEYKDELIKFLTAYKLWDMFDHPKAFNLLKESWKSIDFVDKDQVKANIDFLGRLKSREREDVIEYYKMKLLDLMENSKRRIETNLYDDAVARLYRATEVIAQIMLRKEGYDDPIVLSKDDNKHEEILRKFEKFAEFKERKAILKLGVINKLELLSELGVDLAIEMRKDDKLKDLLTKRNRSILAHGFTPIAERDAKKFYEHLLSYVKELYGKHFEKDLNGCTFPKLKVLK